MSTASPTALNEIARRRNAFRRIPFGALSLRVKLIIGFLAVSLIPLAAMGYLNNRATQQALIDDANQKLSGAASQAAETLDNFVDSNLIAIRTEAQLPPLINYLSLPADQRAGSVAEAEANATLRALSRKDQNFIVSYALLDRQGFDVVDSYTPDVGVDKSDREYFKTPFRTGLPFISAVEFLETPTTASLYFSSPVFNADGESIGVLRVRYDAAVLQQIIARDTGLAGKGSFAMLLDDHHIWLAHGDAPNLIHKSVMPMAPTTFIILQSEGRLPNLPPEELSVNLPELDAALSKSASQPHFTGEVNEVETSQTRGVEQAAIVSMTTRPWSVVFVQNQTQFLEPVEAQARATLFLALVIAATVVALALFVAQQLSNPIVRLTAVAGQVAAGDLAARAPVQSADEIGVLAEAFNSMTATLQTTLEGLEQRVADRTKALASVAEISTATSTILETDKLLQEVVELSKERFNFYHSHIYLLNEAGDRLVLASGAGEPGRRMVAEGRSIPLDREQSLVARAARERKGVTVNDVTRAPDFLPNPLLPETRSELAAPMIVGENVIGVFDVQSDEVGRFTDADIDIQTALASQIAIAVQNARLYSRAETSKQEAQSLVDFAPEAIIVVDLETGLFTDPNANAEKLYGLPRGELLKVGPAQMSPPNQPDGRDSTEKAMEKIGEAMQGGTPVFEWIHRNAQGQDFPCEVRLVRLPGAHPRVRASVTDITERKRFLELTTQRAKQQEALNLITQRIQSTTTVEAALQITARELGRALGMKPTLVALDPSDLTGKSKSN